MVLEEYQRMMVYKGSVDGDREIANFVEISKYGATFVDRTRRHMDPVCSVGCGDSDGAE